MRGVQWTRPRDLAALYAAAFEQAYSTRSLVCQTYLLYANVINSQRLVGSSDNMAILDPALLPPPSRPSPAIAPTLSAIRSSPLSSGSLGSYPITTASFTSSPTLSSTQRDSSPSPDFLRGFVYSQEMDDDFSRVDREFEAERLRDEFIFSQAHNRVLVSESPPPAPRDQKTWVVFHGKVPGIYED